MRVRHTSNPLPRDFSGCPGADRALLVAQVRVRPTSRLWMALLVFPTVKDLRRFWRLAFGTALGKDCLGAVQNLGIEVMRESNGEWIFDRLEVDPRYFAVMGLVQGYLSMEIVTHESVHAGFAYAKRVKGRNLWHGAIDMDEENVCYPAGRIAREVTLLLHDNGLYELKARKKAA